MKLFALSDLHIGNPDNRDALHDVKPHPEDWLILGGDLGETEQHLAFVLGTLRDRFARLIWVPGNHELWTLPHREVARGEEKYLRLVELCRRYDVLTPEDPYVLWPGPPGPRLIAPLFLLYDYSFRPTNVPVERAVDWAREAGIECVDEYLLHPDPYPSRPAWCEARCRLTAARLEAALGQYDVPRCSSITSRCARSWPCCRSCRALPYGVGPIAPRTGTSGSAPRWWCSGTCTSGRPG